MGGMFLTQLLINLGMNLFDAVAANQQGYEQQDAYQREIDRTKRKQEEELSLMDLNFDIAEKEANKSADRSDEALNMSERAASFQTNASIDNLSLQQIADAYSFNNAEMQQSANKGSELAAIAGSGTRTSSVNTAIDNEVANNQTVLDNAKMQTRAGYEQTLLGTLQALEQNRFQIQQGRNDANDLRGRFMEGGSERMKYTKQREALNNSFNDTLSDLQMAYDDIDRNRNIKFLGNLFGLQNFETAQTIVGFAKDFGFPTFESLTGK